MHSKLIMIKASLQDKAIVVELLTAAFINNKSVLYIVKNDTKLLQRTRKMMRYSFDKCLRSGEVFLSDDKKACALFVLPGKKKNSIVSVLADLDFIVSVSGISKLFKIIQRQKKINALHPARPFYYLWFLAVSPAVQGKGIGTVFFQELLQHFGEEGSMICLETSTLKNIPWYEKFGFKVYDQLNFAYSLFFMKLENN